MTTLRIELNAEQAAKIIINALFPKESEKDFDAYIDIASTEVEEINGDETDVDLVKDPFRLIIEGKKYL